MIQQVLLGTLLVGSLVTVGFMLYAGDPGRAAWWIGFLPFAVWALVPFAAAAVGAFRWSTSRRSLAVLLAAAFLLTVGSSALLYQAFVTAPDAQSGIVFVFLPFWQLAVLAPFGAIAFALRTKGAGELE